MRLSNYYSRKLPDQIREEMGKRIKEIQPSVPLSMIERKIDSNPAKMIDFTNEKAVLWNIGKAQSLMSNKVN